MTKTILPEQLTISWLQEQYKNGTITPEEVVTEIIRRSEADADMNIWITPPSAEWIRPYLEWLRTLDPSDCPLWGIPFAIKDNIDLAGVPTTAACSDFAYTPDDHAAVIERLLAAGAIPVGKTNLDQFATGLVGTRSPYGETHNSLRPELISGGSSSGSAVAVARGQAAFSLGTDTAGSGRVPAALNGLVGYKPSLGAWPVKGVVPACESLDCVTVFAAELDDVYAVDAVARGYHAEDAWSRRLSDPEPVVPLKLLLPVETPSFYGPFAAEYEGAWAQAVQQLKMIDIPVEYVDTAVFAAAAALLYEGPWVAERWSGLHGFIEANPGSTHPVTEQIVRSGAERYSASSLFGAMHKLQRYKREAQELLRDAVVILPTAGGTWTREQVRENPLATNRDMGRYTNHCNLLDLCAIAIPAGLADEGLPFGITLFSVAEQEGLVRGVAERLAGKQEVPRTNGETKAKAVETASIHSRTDCADTAAAAGATMRVAVAGLHMRGFPLEPQMLACGAHFIEETYTAARYKLLELATTPIKPGLIKLPDGGASIAVEIWEMPVAAFGGFTAAIPAPLGIGKIELADGTEVTGFICEGYAEQTAADITAWGGWRAYMNERSSVTS
ncbi:allophanate hydrolase [Paenibacillus cellulosilyticus]|uniref:Allophanate hydrolase n=1 Tax=Paenibacillus cellulosilyticus TaxID=375489 RepID=A0A2V2YN81_9BACL|nr:allophanate hydrolase [Paenibacillus cellulosilyticus]PWV95983.1 allophanate hydrolase [Paenibacillus cellulosilyticus]QKS48446.1 allophanate hydrolase [Paenibacillus cellulosilyticus]